MTEKNPETGEEKTITVIGETAEGECGLKYIAYPDEGFYIKGVEFGFSHLGKHMNVCDTEWDDSAFESEVKAYLRGEQPLGKIRTGTE